MVVWNVFFEIVIYFLTVGTEGERTDTEELVGRAASQCSAPPDLLPSEARTLLQSATPPPPVPARRYEPFTKRIPSPDKPNESLDDKPRLRFEVSFNSFIFSIYYFILT